jgi:flagellar biosynthesis anti-sigma factor FlgM
MVGIHGINGVPEPKPDRPAGVRDRKRSEDSPASSKDGVSISSKAQRAASTAKLVEIAKSEPDVRTERVAEAKQKIESGEYKKREVVEQLAAKLLKYLP